MIGHEDGVITIDLAESDDAYREKVRAQLAEPYRTMLGHFRHEVGHYYEWQLVRGDDRMARCRELFGDESKDYQAEIDRHYAEGPPDGLGGVATSRRTPRCTRSRTSPRPGRTTCTSATPSRPPREYGLTAVAPVTAFCSFRDVVRGVWIPLSIALNMINRSMGKDDLYPFVIPPPVLDKLDFVASLAGRP